MTDFSSAPGEITNILFASFKCGCHWIQYI